MKLCNKCHKHCPNLAARCSRCKEAFIGNETIYIDPPGGHFTTRADRQYIYDLQNEMNGVKYNLYNANAELNKRIPSEELDVLKQELSDANAELNKYIQSERTLANMEEELSVLKQKYDDLKKEYDLLENIILIQYTETPLENINTSEEVKTKLNLLAIEESDFIKADKAIINSSDLSRKATNNNVKQLLRCFNSEISTLLSSITVKNFDVVRGRINKTFLALNKIFETDSIQLVNAMLEFKLNQAVLIYEYERKKEAEREEQKAIREQMVEEEKVRREIEKEKLKIEKEETQFKNEISKLMLYLQKASDIEKQLYVDKISELEEKVKLLAKDKENVLQREQNTRAGFVYVISNVGSFGNNVYKIGMTRRLEPMDRVKELGDASVPFEFDVHALIFSEDAPTLETTLHQTFRENQINKVNLKKEFFNVELEKIEKVVKEHHNATIQFTMIAKAEQYRQSLEMAVL